MSLRGELSGLRGGDTPTRFQDLDKLAMAVARRLPRGAPAWEDLRQLFLLDVFRPRQGAAESFEALLGRDDAGLRAAVSNRLRQLGLGAMEDGNRFRALKQHVIAALAEPDTNPDEPPLSLQAGADRFSHQAVKQAVDWTQATRRRDWRRAGVRGPAPGLDATELTKLLLDKYPLFDKSPGEPHKARGLQEFDRDPEPALPLPQPPGNPRTRSSSSPATRARRAIDGRWLLDHLRGRLSKEKLDVLSRRFRGETFEEIASALDIGLATAHQWCQDATTALSALILEPRGDARLSRGTVEAALRTAERRTAPEEGGDNTKERRGGRREIT